MLAVERGPKRAETPRWSSAMMLGDGALRADDAVASHRAADGDGPSVKAARTYAVGTSRGAVAAVTRVGPRSLPSGRTFLAASGMSCDVSELMI
eukprot:COSAG06_NODE_26263_length_618_cov_1.181118_1_plen_93_part_10